MQMKKENGMPSCPLFQNLREEELEKAKAFFHAKMRKYGKGESLKLPGESLAHFGCVLSGAVEVFIDDPDGNHLVMAYAEKGDTFGESLCYLGQANPVGIRCVTDSEVLLMDCQSFRGKAPEKAEEQQFVSRFIAMLASRTLMMNRRIQTLSCLTIREKLLTFFAQQETYGAARDFEISMDREHLAAYLGVNRSALSRELSRMKKERLIDYRKNRFRILSGK